MNDNKNEMSTLNGAWFYFDVDGHEIKVWGSTVTGRETIWIDGEEVVNRLSWKLKTRHHIQVEDRELIVEFAVLNVLSGRLGCSIFEGDERVAFAEQAFEASKNPWWIGVLIGLLGVGAYYILMKAVVD